MTHTGWFHRSGRERGEGTLLWVPADVSGERLGPPELTDHPRGLRAAPGAPMSPGPYPVGEVRGRCPAGLRDFLGVASFTVIRGGLTYRVFGTGDECAGGVWFRQQDLGWDGRHIRTWLITATPHGIVADPAPCPPGIETALWPGRTAGSGERAVPADDNNQG